MKKANLSSVFVEKAFSVRQPWAPLILHGGKNVENRSQRTNYRGMVGIHASKTMRKSLVREYGLDPETLPTGVVIGLVELVDCVRNSKRKGLKRRCGTGS
jgi:hypothetical protein